MTYTRLDALRILGNAYHYLLGLPESKWLVTDFNATEILQDKFHHVRRSMTLRDLRDSYQCDYCGRDHTQEYEVEVQLVFKGECRHL